MQSTESWFESMMLRSGLQPCGGSITRTPDPSQPAESNAWANHFAGLFVIDKIHSGALDAEMRVMRDLIACGVVLNQTATQLVVGEQTFEADSAVMTTIYLPRSKRFHYSTCSAAGLRSVTVVVDVTSFTDAYGMDPSHLPQPLRKMIGASEPLIEMSQPSSGVMRIINDIIAKRGMYTELPALYLEGKTLEFVSAWLAQLSQHNAPPPPEHDWLDSRTRTRVAMVKEIIDRKPTLALNVNALARAAAMNRTKLRSAFKAIYGTTVTDYRTALLMQRAENHLKEPGMTVQEAAYLTGYANASSFIVAYKRYFGVSPGVLKRH